MFPSSWQIQTSDAPASKYKAIFSWISFTVLEGERTSTQISAARVRHIKEGGKDSGKKHTDQPAQPGIGGNGCHKRSSNGSGIRLELIA